MGCNLQSIRGANMGTAKLLAADLWAANLCTAKLCASKMCAQNHDIHYLPRGTADSEYCSPPNEKGFRKVFARFSRGFRFQNIFVKGSGEQKKNLINFCVPRGPPPRGAAEPGPPWHAKIGKNHRDPKVDCRKNWLPSVWI